MRHPDNLSPEAERALIDCLRLLARHGRERRLARERMAREQQGASSNEPAAPNTCAVMGGWEGKMASEAMIRALLSQMLLAYPRQGVETDDDRDDLLRVWQDVLSDADDSALGLAAAEYLRGASVWRAAPGVLRARALEIAAHVARGRELRLARERAAKRIPRPR